MAERAASLNEVRPGRPEQLWPGPIWVKAVKESQ